MQDLIINKDAKLSAMKNTLAVMENDLCEPYCIYANIYTELEKIFAVLCQNDKYRRYLLLMVSGKDLRCIDIRGKIIFKLKVLEKFCCSLIAPCDRDFHPSDTVNDSICYRTEVNQINFALTSVETTKNHSDSKRAQLVADIMQNEDMKEILSKESLPDKTDAEFLDDDYIVQDHNIETENLARLKKLQANYDDLTSCYESLKYEKETLEIRCQKYEDLEREFEHLKLQIQEYNSLWNEKEHYRKRSMDLDALKEQYLILTDETENLETQLKAETEINHTKCKALDELWNENLLLEKKLSEARVEFEKEKNILTCKLREADCKIMCQGQQIKSLSLQIDRLLEQDLQMMSTRETEENSITLMDEVESHKDKIKSLQNLLLFNEEEKQNLQKQFQEQLRFVNDLKIEVEDWKSAYEKTLQRNEYLEKYTESLSQDAEDKAQAVENLINVIDRKSQEIDKLISEAEKRKTENRILLQQITQLQKNFDDNLTALESEKMEALKSLQIAREESKELLEKVKDYDQILHSNADVTKSLEIQIETKKDLENQLISATDENMSLKMDLLSHENSNSILIQDIQQLHKVNKFALDNISKLQDENEMYKTSIEIKQKESGELKIKLMHFENLAKQLQNLQDAYEKLRGEKETLENELLQKSYDLDNATRYMQLNKRKSEELVDKLQRSENAKEELLRLGEAYQKLVEEKHILKKDLLEKKNELQNLSQSLNNVKLCNERLSDKCKQIDILNKQVQDLKKTCDELLVEKKALLKDYNKNLEEFNKIHDSLQEKVEENQNLKERIISLEYDQQLAENSLKRLHDDNALIQVSLHTLQQEKADLTSKIQHFETLERGFNELKISHDLMKKEKEEQLANLKRLEKENSELHKHSQTLVSYSDDLEAALISSRSELIKNSTSRDYQDILKEIKSMRQEKLSNQKVIRDLKDKVEESDNIISSLSEEVRERDHKIAIMQNHINELKKEMNNLQNSLSNIVDIGEEMRDFNLQTLESTKNLEAHHSKATHNMKMDFVKLQQQNAKLEEQLSFTKIKSEESSQIYRSNEIKIEHLEQEREIIVTDIKQLEMKTVGDSTLGPSKCDTKDILMSLDRIRNSFDVKNSKTASLEQTILKVKTSSQLLLCKAEEEKKEKQKIINEKENAIRDKQNMEKQLLDFKDKLEKQIADDKTVIKDLEATILNQELLINKINVSTAEYISKLQDELQYLKNLYNESIDKIEELQMKLQNLSADKKLHITLLDKIKEDLDVKSKEVCVLQKELEQLKNKTVFHIETQTNHSTHQSETETQTDDSRQLMSIKTVDRYKYSDKNINTINSTDIEPESEITFPFHNQKLQSNEHPSRFNEMQILTLNVDPTFDYVRNNYISHKLQCLSARMLEQYSISSTSNNERHEDPTEDYADAKKDTNLIDIFNRQKKISKANAATENLITDTKSLRTNTFVEFTNSDNNENETNSSSSRIAASQSGKVLEKDMFIIYKDGLNSYDNKDQENVGWSEIVVENVSIYRNEQKEDSYKTHNVQNTLLYFEQEEGQKEENDSVKVKLKIEMPRVDNESNSLINTVNSAKKSLDSYTDPCYSTSTKFISTSDTKIIHDENSRKTLLTTTISNGESLCLEEISKEHSILHQVFTTDAEISSTKKHKISDKKSKSHHKLSRVEANVLLLKNEKYSKQPTNSVRNFGLNYIMDTVHAEVNPNDCKGTSEEIRSVKSEEIFNTVTDGTPDFKLSKLCNDKFTPVYKTLSNLSKFSKKSNKTFADKAIMANLDTSSDYEKIIDSLTKALENIERDYKKKIEAIKVQYDINIKSIINEHNQGVRNIQYLHEDTLHDIIKTHENEVENLRSMSIEAMRKADLLEKENHALKIKVHDCGNMCLDKNLDAQELSFLHLKVCRMWKNKLNKEEALQKRIDSLETELINKQRNTQQHIAELDRKVAEERRRLQIVRDAVCRSSGQDTSRACSPESETMSCQPISAQALGSTTTYTCNTNAADMGVSIRGSAGDLAVATFEITPHHTITRPDNNRAVLAKLDKEERREKRLYNDEPPTRLRRSHDRQMRLKK